MLTLLTSHIHALMALTLQVMAVNQLWQRCWQPNQGKFLFKIFDAGLSVPIVL